MNLFTRRNFSRSVLLASMASAAWPLLALAGWSRELFRRDQYPAIHEALTDGQTVQTSDLIEIDAPDTIADGASIRVVITSSLPNVQSISVLIKDNPRPLCCRATFSYLSSTYFATSVRMRSSSVLIALVETSEGFFSREKPIAITLAGCT